MNILTINCGSSSIKYQLFRMERSRPLLKGIAEKIGSRDSFILHEKAERKRRLKLPLENYFQAVETIAGLLIDPEWGAVKSQSQIAAVGHRVVHGGEEFKSAVIIDDYVLEQIKHYRRLAPLHNPPAYNGIKAARKIFPQVRHAAVFDTAFHQTMPPEAFIYALPYELYKKHGIRRYGFHGTSHRYVAHEAARVLKRPLQRLKLITCHLGNGCSISAVRHGHSVDTSMGFTPLEGLVMGTRSGDIDPALVSFIMRKERIGVDQVEDMLNRKSGLLGLSGLSNDMRDLLAKRQRNRRAQLAIDVFIYRVKKYIGAYMAVMDGADAIVLTAGIGENMPLLRQRLKRELRHLLGRRTKLLTIHTDEEKLIARDTYGLIRK